LNSADFLAYVLAVVLVLYAARAGGLRGGGWGAALFVTAVGAHMCVAFLSYNDIPPPSLDNLSFHLRALSFVYGTFDYELRGPNSFYWSYAIAQIYQVFGDSFILAYIVNQYIFFFLLLQVMKFADEIRMSGTALGAVFLLAFLPSSLLFANLLYREPFQMLCTVVAMRMLERFRQTGSYVWFCAAALPMIPYGIIHNNFFVFGPMMLVMGAVGRVFFAPRGAIANPFAKMATLLVAAAALAVTMVYVGTALEYTRAGGAIAGDIDLAEGLATSTARTTLPWAPPPGPVGILLYSPVLLVQFIFAPIMPFMVTSAVDIVPAVDVLFRALMLYGTCRFYRNANGEGRKLVLFLLMFYFAFCFLSAVGTSTVGTAMRHQLKVFWLLLPMGLAGLYPRLLAAPRWRYPANAPGMADRG
jgi:hypothetical protein